MPLRKNLFITTLVCLVAVLAPLAAWAHGEHTADSPHFSYDISEVINATMTQSPEFYQPSLGYRNDDKRPWMAFLHYEPGQGDAIWAGPVTGGRLREPVRVFEGHGVYAAPTVSGRWITVEEQASDDDKWQVIAIPFGSSGSTRQKIVLSSPDHHAINHRVAETARGELWVVWQGEHRGQYDIFARRLSPDGSLGAIERISETPGGDWRPAVTAAANGSICVAWDSFTGESFDILSRWFENGAWGDVGVVAGTPAFEGRPDVTTDRRGWTWICWEEGATAWGTPFRGKDPTWNNITDGYGPVHRFRKVHLARLYPDGRVEARPVPMPSFAAAAAQDNRRTDATKFGVFYEHPRLAVDSRDRPWLTYRHFFADQVGLDEESEHHVEYGWGIYARCLEEEGWSDAYSFNIHQRDGMQRLSALPTENGLLAAWATGRTDRRIDPMPRGIATGGIERPEGEAPGVDTAHLRTQTPPPMKNDVEEDGGVVVVAPGLDIYYGDLHRHTDLSLCWPFLDGTIEDAYRYAIEVGGLQFLGITDHTRDLDHGDALSQLWWRSTKEARRHELVGAFVPLFAFERSHGDTDHNVISLRDDMIRDYPTPLRFYWNDLGKDTFTIPHAPFRDRTWRHQDDAHRPLAEIYQGCRDYDSQEHVHKGLDKGYRIGIIASSDHLSTSASYACVWAPDGTREGIFRSMQARRTFGATTHIRLRFQTGEHWMGETIESASVPAFSLAILGTAPLKQIEVLHNGVVVESLDPKGRTHFEQSFTPDVTLRGEDYFYVHAVQADGNRAWSSPIWVTSP
jgi:hypothetical protein